MLVYISGPYSAPTEEEKLANVERANEAAVEVMKRGHTPIVPHLTHYVEKTCRRLGLDVSWDRWLEMDLEILGRCDYLIFLAPSPGALMEKGFALGRDIPVWSLDQYCAVFKEKHGK